MVRFQVKIYLDTFLVFQEMLDKSYAIKNVLRRRKKKNEGNQFRLKFY